MKKLMGLGAVALGALPVLAENELTGAATVSSLATDLSEAVTEMATSVFPIVSGIAVAFAVFWLGRIAIRVIKSWTSASK